MNLLSCVLIGTIITVGLTAVMTGLSIYVEPISAVSRTNEFQLSALAMIISSMILLIAGMFYPRNAILRRSAFLLMFVGITGALMAATQLIQSKTLVLVTLLSVVAILSILLFVGIYDLVDMSQSFPALFSILIVVIIASVLNIVIFKSDWIGTTISAGSIILFSLLVIWDIQYVKKGNGVVLKKTVSNGTSRWVPDKIGACEAGVMNIWLDFANILMSAMDLLQGNQK